MVGRAVGAHCRRVQRHGSACGRGQRRACEECLEVRKKLFRRMVAVLGGFLDAVHDDVVEVDRSVLRIRTGDERFDGDVHVAEFGPGWIWWNVMNWIPTSNLVLV